MVFSHKCRLNTRYVLSTVYGGVLSVEEIGAYNTIVWFLGVMCCILVAGSRFAEGFVDDVE